MPAEVTRASYLPRDGREEVPEPKTIKFSIEADGAPRLLFSLRESSNKDVMLIIRPGGFFGDGPEPTNEVLEQRYSIHRSASSADYNTIVHTIKLAGGNVYRLSHLTDAIKKRSGFAHVYSRLCPWLDTDQFAASEKDKQFLMSLGAYETGRFTLVHSVFVGACDQEFECELPRDTNLAQKQFCFLRVVVLWSFLTLPSHAEGYLMHGHTIKPELVPDPVAQEELRKQMRGRSENDCLGLFAASKSLMRSIHMEVVSRVAKMDAQIVDAVADYLPHGSSCSAEYAAYEGRMKEALGHLSGRIDEEGMLVVCE
jgi:hypothetical protein